MCRPSATTSRFGIPTRRTEREELRRVRQVDDAARRRLVGLAQQDVAHVFRGNQQPIRFELADLLS
jgi:hypothetical protein